jgi:hypothetical protein
MRTDWKKLVAATAVAAVGLGLGWAWAQEDVTPEPPPEGARQVWRVPSGVYTGIVLAVAGHPEQPPREATIRTRDGAFTVIVPAGSTVIVPLPSGWSVSDDEVRIRFDAGGAAVDAWGLTAHGPAAFR